jgi:hypothetical protein
MHGGPRCLPIALPCPSFRGEGNSADLRGANQTMRNGLLWRDAPCMTCSAESENAAPEMYSVCFYIYYTVNSCTYHTYRPSFPDSISARRFQFPNRRNPNGCYSFRRNILYILNLALLSLPLTSPGRSSSQFEADLAHTKPPGGASIHASGRASSAAPKSPNCANGVAVSGLSASSLSSSFSRLPRPGAEPW